MPIKTRQDRTRASPLLGAKVPFAHTQDFFAALRNGLAPENIKHPILRAIARAMKYRNLDPEGRDYLADRHKGVWFEFAFINKEGQKVVPRLEEFTGDGQLPEWVHSLPCRKCYGKNAKVDSDTFAVEVIVSRPGKNPPIKVGFLTIECWELVADGIDENDFL